MAVGRLLPWCWDRVRTVAYLAGPIETIHNVGVPVFGYTIGFSSFDMASGREAQCINRHISML